MHSRSMKMMVFILKRKTNRKLIFIIINITYSISLILLSLSNFHQWQDKLINTRFEPSSQSFPLFRLCLQKYVHFVQILEILLNSHSELHFAFGLIAFMYRTVRVLELEKLCHFPRRWLFTPPLLSRARLNQCGSVKKYFKKKDETLILRTKKKILQNIPIPTPKRLFGSDKPHSEAIVFDICEKNVSKKLGKQSATTAILISQNFPQIY